MAYNFSKNWLFILMIGIIWEFIELLLSYNSILNCYLLNYGRNKYTKWWYGRYNNEYIWYYFWIIFKKEFLIILF